MNKEKISSQEIIDLVASKASVSKRAAEEFLKVMISSVEEALLAGEVVKIKSFGTFKLQWNEPRKSVNIQTGEEIKIAGYYKVVFIPDVILKEQVNEPFSHLEPVVLDGEIKTELVNETEQASDPLRIFMEQASEIKNLISEIQALSPNPVSAISEEINPLKDIPEEEKAEEVIQIDKEPEGIKEEDTLSLTEEDNIEYQHIIQSSSNIVTENVVENIDENVIEDQSDSPENSEKQLFSELAPTPFLDNIQSGKRKKIWLWVVLIVFLVTGLGAGIYYLYSSDSEFSRKYSAKNISENISISEIMNTVSKWFAPSPKLIPKTEKIIIPKDTTDLDSIHQIQPVDTLQILFDTPRVYDEFIASERITSGSRLTIMSKRYYGTKDFWVYIYEANKERIKNPDDIAIGTLIRIPKVNPRLIDASNPRCIQKAKELHDIYIK